jgi:FixJ family two-component response regulator
MTAARIVAVVDDDDRVRESLEDLLESVGHAVQGFASAEALLKSRTWSTLDLLITDITMDVIDGLALHRKLQSERPYIPVILVTGCTGFLERREQIEASGAPVFFKPFDAGALLQTIAEKLSEC